MMHEGYAFTFPMFANNGRNLWVLLALRSMQR